MHPFAKPRERSRALVAAKLERMFAKPFLASLEGHSDSVNVIVRKPDGLATIASASADGGLILLSWSDDSLTSFFTSGSFRNHPS